MIKMVEVNDTQFDALVLKSSLPVLVEFSSPECIICKTMAERIKEASKNHVGQVVFLRMNINENKRWQDYDIRVIPTLVYFKNGVVVERQSNFPEADEISAQIHLLIKKVHQ